jgi:zinc and cadmium transporter
LSTLQLILAFTALSGALSALAAGLFLTLGDARRAAVLPHLVSFATGTLLGAAFLGLIPHALEGAGAGGTHGIGLSLLIGIMLFFLLEKFVLWRHCHDDPCEAHSPDQGARDHASANLILVGDTFHNWSRRRS